MKHNLCGSPNNLGKQNIYLLSAHRKQPSNVQNDMDFV